jgi:hypothetical protein
MLLVLPAGQFQLWVPQKILIVFPIPLLQQHSPGSLVSVSRFVGASSSDEWINRKVSYCSREKVSKETATIKLAEKINTI